MNTFMNRAAGDVGDTPPAALARRLPQAAVDAEPIALATRCTVSLDHSARRRRTACTIDDRIAYLREQIKVLQALNRR